MILDDALVHLGAYGRYQMMLYFAISLFDNLPSIWHMNVGAFLGYEPEHHCKVSLLYQYCSVIKTYSKPHSANIDCSTILDCFK
jgi:hypothetical protein